MNFLETYEEGIAKCEKLNTEKYGVTTDSEADVEQKIKDIVKALKIKCTKSDSDNLNNLMSVPPLEQLITKDVQKERSSSKFSKAGEKIIIMIIMYIINKCCLMFNCKFQILKKQ